MVIRATLSILIAAVAASSTILLWRILGNTNEEQIARIAEAESYAARSQLIQNINTMLRALRNARAHWATFGHLPADQWDADTGFELEHFPGLGVILWSDAERDIRFVRTPDNRRFDYRPADDEWRTYTGLISRARNLVGDHILGPFDAENGQKYFEIVIAGARPNDRGTLAATVDIERMFGSFLAEESPGFSVQVFAGDELIFRRGTGSSDAPSSWTHDGLIRTSFGSIWRVEHAPTDEMLRSFDSPAIDLSLLLGLIVAVLLGTLIYENGRAQMRAAAAEAAETRLAQLNRALEHLVEYRTRELAERSDDLQTLTDSVAHDLRNPLNSMSVNLQLLDEHFADRLGGDGATILRRLSPCIHQMTDVLDRLLGLSTVANATFEREEIDLEDLARTTFADLAASEPQPAAKLIVGRLPAAQADRTLTQILLMNLLGNALKYSRVREERMIRVDAETVDGETIYSITDNGIGFDAEKAEQIFEAFARAHDDADRDGVGLGLTLARKVVVRHEGRIWATSSPGDGATFYFTLAPASERQA